MPLVRDCTAYLPSVAERRYDEPSPTPTRLETFETCPLKYKLRYIDGIKTEVDGIEAFTGSRVRDVLEKLYIDRLDQRGDGTYEIHDNKTSGTLPERSCSGHTCEEPELAARAQRYTVQVPTWSQPSA